jgi:hypothetical protein
LSHDEDSHWANFRRVPCGSLFFARGVGNPRGRFDA